MALFNNYTTIIPLNGPMVSRHLILCNSVVKQVIRFIEIGDISDTDYGHYMVKNTAFILISGFDGSGSPY